jgi:hypothetical protein
MKRKSILVGVLVLGLLLAVAVGMTQAQEPEFPEGEAGLEAVNAVAAVSGRIPIQGRLTDAGGNPLNGTYDIQFALYDAATIGTMVCEDTNSVTVDNGLFYSEIWGTCGSDDIDGRQLYLGIKVGTDPEMTPRQGIYPVPYASYASSLRPGTAMSATLSSTAILDIENWGSDGRGLRSYAMSQTGANWGVVGASRSPDGFGGYFYNTSASPNNGFAVAGLHPGYSVDDLGSWVHPAGYFAGRIGVIGYTKDPGGTAVLALINDSTGWAGMFTGIGNGIRVSVPAGKVGLEVIDGSKSAVVGTEDGARLLYTEESTEVWFTDYGFGQLEDGLAVIPIDSVFAQTVNLEQPYHVFVQVYGDAEVYVTDRTAAGFEVHLRDGDPGVEFSYRIVGKRIGYEDDRLERAPWDDDLVLNP